MKKILRYVLCALFALGLLSSVVTVKVGRTANAASMKVDESAVVARRIAEEGTVLLRNTGVLPLKTTDDVAGLGAAQENAQVYGGNGSGTVRTDAAVSYAQGLQQAAQDGKIKSYVKAANTGACSDADKVLYFISRSTSEGSDMNASAYELSSAEKSDISSLISAHGALNVAVILNVGCAIDTAWLTQTAKVGAILVAYYGGEYAGTALARILTGDVSPSGKTVDTWATSYADYPSASIGDFGTSRQVDYVEDIYVGYRYFETFEKSKILYPFGFGLSYTTFAVSGKTVSVENGTVTAKATVKNTGACAGKETVQVYYQILCGTAGAAKRELGGFQKTRLLQPNESETVVISFALEDMAVYDDTGDVRINSWYLPAARVQVRLNYL